MLIYLRNTIILVAIQALIVLYCVNLTIVEHFNMRPFSYGEIFLLCFGVCALSHSIRNVVLSTYLNDIKLSIHQNSSLNFIAAKTLLEKMEDIENQLKNIKDNDG